jgi:hypothetical protein
VIVNWDIRNPLCQILHIHTFSSNHFQNNNPKTIFTDRIRLLSVPILFMSVNAIFFSA